MGRVWVHGADIADGRVQRLQVKMGTLPRRVIDRDTAISWMKDMHSFIPLVGGVPAAALQLVRVGDDDEPFIRTDNALEAEDQLPALPATGS